MTSYEGLYLCTHRPQEGRDVLRSSAHTVSEGMLANTADTGTLEYNTIDGTLWFTHALARHLDVTGDVDLGDELSSVVEEIVTQPPPSQRIVLCCRSGQRSLMAAERLRARGLCDLALVALG